MSGLESAQTGIDNVGQQGGSDQYWARPIVDMANPSEFRNLVRPLDSQSQAAVSSNGQLVFDNPYGSSGSNSWPGQWNDGNAGNQSDGHWGGDQGEQRGGQGSGQPGSEGGINNFVSEVGALSTELGTLQTDVNTVGQLSQSGVVQTDSATTTATTPTDSATTTTATTPTDSATTTTAATPTGSDATTAAVAAPGANPTASADPLVTQLAQSGDPTLAGTLVDASSQLSAQGYGQLEQYVGQNYSGSVNDNQLMNQALTQAGLSPSDASALQNVLATDMPQALSSSDSTGTGSDSGSPSSQTSNASIDQQILAQLQQIGQEVQQLTAEVTQMLGGGGSDSSGAGDTTGTGSQSTASASSDPFLAGLQTSDPTMAQTLTDSSNQLSPQGFQQLEQYVEQNYTGPNNDSQLMSQALTQAGLSSSDDSALENVLQSDMPSALTPSSSNANGAGGASDAGTTTTTSGTGSGDNGVSGGAASGNGSDTPPATTGTTGSDTPPATTGTTGSDTGSGSMPTSGGDAGSTPGSGFTIQNGQLLINGQLLSGVATSGQYAQQVGGQELANEISTEFPGINVVRLATSPDGGAFTQGGQTGNFYTESGDESIQNIEQTVQALNAKGIGVIIDNHTSDASTPNNVSEDGNEAAWFSQLATAELGNNMVMFQTENEPTGTDAAIQQEQQSAYNAIRATGSDAVVAFDIRGGGDTSNITDNAATYDQDSNYVIDAHAYLGTASDPAGDLQQEVSSLSSMTEANGGAAPVYIGEVGNSTYYPTVDANATANLDAAFSGGTGAIAWWYNPGFSTSEADQLANPDGSLNAYGQQTAALIANGAA